MKEQLNELALFAGAGGGILGGKLLGWKTICAVEWEPYARDVLVARQNDGCLAPFPIWDDVQTFDGKPWRGRVDVVSGGFPCQDISSAGKGAGIEGTRSGMWVEMARIISEVRPRFAFVENSPMLTSRGLGTVLGDLAEMGYHARWGVMGGSQVYNSPILRERIWIFASSVSGRWETGRRNRQNKRQREAMESAGLVSSDHGWNDWNQSPEAKARVLGMADGVAGELDGIKCCGNGQVPAVVKLAWNTLNNI